MIRLEYTIHNDAIFNQTIAQLEITFTACFK